jgi:hypothetical protein
MQTGWKINKVGLGVISPKFTFDKFETIYFCFLAHPHLVLKPFVFGTNT